MAISLQAARPDGEFFNRAHTVDKNPRNPVMCVSIVGKPTSRSAAFRESSQCSYGILREIRGVWLLLWDGGVLRVIGGGVMWSSPVLGYPTTGSRWRNDAVALEGCPALWEAAQLRSRTGRRGAWTLAAVFGAVFSVGIVLAFRTGACSDSMTSGSSWCYQGPRRSMLDRYRVCRSASSIRSGATPPRSARHRKPVVRAIPIRRAASIGPTPASISFQYASSTLSHLLRPRRPIMSTPRILMQRCDESWNPPGVSGRDFSAR